VALPMNFTNLADFNHFFDLKQPRWIKLLTGRPESLIQLTQNLVSE